MRIISCNGGHNGGKHVAEESMGEKVLSQSPQSRKSLGWLGKSEKKGRAYEVTEIEAVRKYNCHYGQGLSSSSRAAAVPCSLLKDRWRGNVAKCC